MIGDGINCHKHRFRTRGHCAGFCAAGTIPTNLGVDVRDRSQVVDVFRQMIGAEVRTALTELDQPPSSSNTASGVALCTCLVALV
jgi:hypothetical protein